jgi:hypothetical protein
MTASSYSAPLMIGRQNIAATISVTNPAQMRSNMTIDNQSPAGAWADELKAAPWGYGQERDWRINNALANVRMRGLWTEASTLANEINALKAEIARLTNSQSS